MGGWFSSVSKQFLGSIVLSAGLPAALLVLVGSLLLVPLLPDTAGLVARLEALGPEWKTVTAVGAVVVVAVLLSSLNIPLIRLYEGYPWKESWLGRWRCGRHRRRFERTERYWRGLRTVLRALPEGDPSYPDLLKGWNAVGRELVDAYPSEAGRTLPTRFGNMIRSFEDYPRSHYGIHGVTLWPRLAGSVDPRHAAALDEAKTSLDFMLNSAFVSTLLALLVLTAGFAWPERVAEQGLAAWGVSIGVLSVLGWLFYLGAIRGAASWGAVVKATFDLFRWDLLARLGYTEPPRTPAEEWKLWDEITTGMIFGRLSTGTRRAYRPAPPRPEPPTPGDAARELAAAAGKLFTALRAHRRPLAPGTKKGEAS